MPFAGIGQVASMVLEFKGLGFIQVYIMYKYIKLYKHWHGTDYHGNVLRHILIF